MKLHFFVLLLFLGCTKQPMVTKSEPAAPVNNKVKEGLHFTDTFVFDKYNDNGDYLLLIAYKKDNIFSFVNTKEDRSLLKGDVVKITWKEDRILSPVESEKAESANWIVTLKKIKNGTVSNFRNTYKKEISYYYDTTLTYSQSYLNDLYLITEYYIANSQNKLLKHLIENNYAIQYSIEQQTRNKQEYTVLGISSETEHRVSTIQWLYYNVEKDLLYEYDLINDTLIAFK